MKIHKDLSINLLNDMIHVFFQLLPFNSDKGIQGVQTLSIPWTLFAQISNSLKTQEKTAHQNCCSEIEDIQRSKNGDPDAFQRLVEQYQKHVSKLLWRFTRDLNTHEELVQECFVQVYTSLPKYTSIAPFEHWISRIATRVGYRFWKQNNRFTHASLENMHWEPVDQNQTESMEPQQAAELVHNLLAKLPPRDRLVLTLRYLEQCSVQETARRTGLSESLVKVQTHRAKQKLKKLLKNSNIEFEL